ncbi:MAG: bifunctional phosphopantothenoylcysteine decarboxylase/phosphopantothenate--cysteine ligase CoaBC [Bacteroidetes bacterium]|nr:MAG: bifunctional phosphopantothenoylcysteine decarboxylase/phosphopantothenate--cysteine ligase CoaBC [Bacteroidota bacterium]
MVVLTGKNILIGITGSIAAYKSAFLTRLFVKAGAHVKVVMTPAAKDFITPLTLSTLSKNPVYSEFTSGDKGEWNNHVELAQWADIILIAPATADIIAKMANGICDNLLLAVYLAHPNPPEEREIGPAALPLRGSWRGIFVAPAMDLDMFQHPSTKANLQKLQSYGNVIIPPDKGELASGLSGEGRMAEPEAIVQFLSELLKKKLPLSGKKALVTAGPTHEAIDPVRFIGNHSSGKMGFAVAEELAARGVEVTLVCGPNVLVTNNKAIRRVDVTSADEMYQQCMKYSKNSDIIVMAAAVADFKPAKSGKGKIKKETGLDEIKLVPTKDILSELGKHKNGSLLVGFALETENETANAKKKLHNKNMDIIVLNSLKDEKSGFDHDTNKITIFHPSSALPKGERAERKIIMKEFNLMSKIECARVIVNEVIQHIVKR